MYSSLLKIEINLLLAFNAVYRHRSANKASEELGIQQSALSHLLKRLRIVMDDELFIRANGDMVPTAKAERMAKDISFALDRLLSCINDLNSFKPEKCSDIFTIAVTEYAEIVILPDLIVYINSLAPKIRIKAKHIKNYSPEDIILSGSADFVLGFEDTHKIPRRGIEGITLAKDNFVVAVRHDHPKINKSLSREMYLNAEHIITQQKCESSGVIERILKDFQTRRKLLIEMPSAIAAINIVKRTNMVFTYPKNAILSISPPGELKIFSTPFMISQYIVKAYYDSARCHNPSYEWIKNKFLTFQDFKGDIQRQDALYLD